MTSTATVDQVTEQRDALVGRLFEAAIGTLDIFSIYLGDRLGLYQGVAELGSPTAAELARHTGIAERYAREWLEQQTATGVVSLEQGNGFGPARFRLPSSHQEVLLDSDSLNYLTGLLRLVVGAAKPLPAVLQAFRTGGGVAYADYGQDTLEGIAEMNRPLFLNLLGTAWLPAIGDVHARLEATPPARVADVGCGSGWSSIAIAKAYPRVTVHGFDLDEASIRLARANAREQGLSDRVSFEIRDAAAAGLAGSYDLVTAFETIHDMARPVEALRQMRSLVKPGGAVVIADERVGEALTVGDSIERLNYGFSILHCLPACLAESPSAATGTVMRPGTLQAYATAAGYAAVEILPIENDFWRFYRLRP